MFSSMGVSAKKITRLVHTTDAAPTLSQLVGAKTPSGAFGAVLVEIAERKR